MQATLTRLCPLSAVLLSAAAVCPPTIFTGIGLYVNLLPLLIMLAMGVILRL